ncbi:MAG: permease prefix domain 1-containing protein [Planctomycetota bacterium]|jgi:hypothetical protein
MRNCSSRRDEAREVLDSWSGHASLLADGSWSLIELLVLNAVLSITEKNYTEVYRELGDAEAAEETIRLVRRIEAPLKAYRDSVSSESGDAAPDAEREEFERRLRRSGGVFVQTLMPFLGDEWRFLGPDALASGAQLEHTLLEEAGLVLALALVLLAMLAALLVALRWRASLDVGSRPLLVLPSWHDAARILGLGVLAPLAGFLVYTRWSGLAGREFALTYLMPRFAVEVVLLVVTIMFLTVSLGSAFVRRRLLDMGEEAPAEARARRIVSGAGLAVLWAAWLFVRGEGSAAVVGTVEVAVVGVALLAAIVVGVMRLFFGRDKRFGRFYGSAARSLLPILAAAAGRDHGGRSRRPRVHKTRTRPRAPVAERGPAGRRRGQGGNGSGQMSEGDHGKAAERAADVDGNALGELLDEATSSLRDDAELQLDVRAELASHLEDKRDDFVARGLSSEEALDLARQSFGPPDTVARDLLAANRRRMKLRALARLALRAAVVPAGLAAVFMFASREHLRPLSAAPARAFGEPDPSNMGSDLSFLVLNAESRRWEELSPEARLIVSGDWRRSFHHERIGAIWAAHPARIEFCADYVVSFAVSLTRLREHIADRLLPRSKRSGRPEAVEHARSKLARGMAKFERDLARAGALDPDNAFFDYLHAAVLAAGGCREEWVPPTAEDRARPPLVHRTKFVVVDRELLDRAAKALLAGDAKPRCDSYAVESRRSRLAAVPREEGVSGILRRLSVWCGLTRGLGAPQRRLVSSLAARADMLASEGRGEESLRILDATVRVFSRSVSDVDEHWSNRNALTLAQSVAERLPPVYVGLGRAAEAERVRALAEQIKAAAKSGVCGLDEDVWKNISTHGGGACDFLHRAGSGDRDVLAAAREIDQLLLDRAGTSLLLMTLFALAAGCAFVSVRWRLPRSKVEAVPPILPRPAFLARALGLGVILPLAAFFIYTQWSGISGREYSIAHLGHRFLLEIVLLVVTITAVVVSLARGYVRDRCADLGTPAPRRTSSRLRAGLWSALAVAWALCLAMRGEGSERAAHLIVTAVLSLAVIGLAAELVHVAGRRRPFTAYYAALARTLVLTFAAAALVAGCVTALHLRARGRRIALRADAFELDEELQTPKFDAGVFRPIRADLARIVRDFETETARGR